MEPSNELPPTEEMETQVDMEEEDSSEDESSEDDSFNCADSEVKDILDCVLTRTFRRISHRVTRERFCFILQLLLNEPEFLIYDHIIEH